MIRHRPDCPEPACLPRWSYVPDPEHVAGERPVPLHAARCRCAWAQMTRPIAVEEGRSS